MSEIVTERITLKVDRAPDMQAYVARPAEPVQAPGMMVFQEAFGVREHIRDVTERLARAGFTAIAPELFHRTLPPGSELSYDNFPAVMPHMQALSTENIASDVRACYDWLTHDTRTDAKRIGCMGFCLGGRTSYIACATVPVQGAISFYGGGIGPGRGPTLEHLAPQLHAPILFFWGGKDTHILAEHVRPIEQALDQAAKDYVNVRVSFADHGFMRAGSERYSEKGAKMAWELSAEFLKLYVIGGR